MLVRAERAETCSPTRFDCAYFLNTASVSSIKNIILLCVVSMANSFVFITIHVVCSQMLLVPVCVMH